MGFSGHLHRFRSADLPVVGNTADKMNDKETGVVANKADTSVHSDSDTDKISDDAQLGVQSIQAVTKVWTRNDIILAYVTYVGTFAAPIQPPKLTPAESGSSTSSTPCSKTCPTRCWPT